MFTVGVNYIILIFKEIKMKYTVNSYVFLRFFLGVGGGGVNVNSLMVVETPLFFFPGDL
jgi:hypothetical protein